MGLGSWEVQPQLSRIVMEPKSVVLISNDSEELNRAMILTLARAVHVTGTELRLSVRNRTHIFRSSLDNLSKISHLRKI